MKINFSVYNLYVFLFITIPFISKSQMLGEEGFRLYDFRDTEGSLIKFGSEMGVVGSPMLREGWAAGTIKFKSGKTFTDTAINYSLYTNKLYLKRDDRYLELVQPADAFTLTFQLEGGATVDHHFKSGYPAVNDLTENSFYEVYFDGKNIQLVGWLHKKVVQPFTYGGPSEKSYSLIQDFYLYHAAEKKMIPISSFSPDALKKLIPGYASNISTYCSSHKVSSKNREQYVGLLSFLDTN